MTALLCTLSLLVGFLIGITLDDALALYRASRKDRHMSRVKVPAARTILAIGLVIGVILQLGVGVFIIFERAARVGYAECNAQWQQKFAAAYSTRLVASSESSEALEAVVRSVRSNDRAKIDAAIDAYLVIRDRQVRQQERNPYPALPDELCGARP